MIKLDDEVKVIVDGSGREKWSTQFMQTWELNKKEQHQMWENNLKNAFNRIFLYEYRVESYKKKMRQEINEIFQLPNSQWTESNLTRKFEDIFDKTLREIQTQFPPINVKEEVGKVYHDSSVIKSRKLGPTDNNASNVSKSHHEEGKKGCRIYKKFADNCV